MEVAVSKRLSLARQFLLLQICIVVIVAIAVGGVSIAQSATSFRETEGRRLLSVAETVAANDAVRLGLVDQSARSALPGVAESARGVSGASTVLIADAAGVLRTGPDTNRRLDIGASTVTSGRAWVGEVNGQLVAHVPVLDANGSMVGLVAAGRRYPTWAERFGTVLPNLIAYLVLGCVLGVAGSLLLARRVSRQTLGLHANEIVGLAEHREAMLHGIKEGVIALDPQGRITLANDEATRLLGLPPNAVGLSLDSMGLSRKLRSVLTGRTTGTDVVVLHGDRVLVLNHTAIALRGSSLGSVTTLRDRTDIVAMQHELEVTRYTTDAMHSQAQTFAAKMGSIHQLITRERYEDAARQAGQASVAFRRLSVEIAAQVADPGVAAMLLAKCSLAAASGADLHLARGSTLPRLDGALSVDLVAILGAMIDRALDGLGGSGSATTPLEVTVQYGLGALYLAVRDSGRPVAAVPTHPASRHGLNGHGMLAATLDRDVADPLTTAHVICTRRGGQVGWADGDHPLLEAWLPVGIGAP